MDKQMTISAFSDELAQVRTKKKEFLSQIERIVPWKEWLAIAVCAASSMANVFPTPAAYPKKIFKTPRDFAASSVLICLRQYRTEKSARYRQV